MSLDRFRSVDIRIDKADHYFMSSQFAKGGDYNGRTLVVQITNGGMIESQAGITVNLGWRHESVKNSGLDPFEVVDAAQGIFEIPYPREMLNPGRVTAVIQIIDGETITETKNFVIQVEKSPIDETSIVSSNSFTVLQEALIKVNGWNARIDAVEADFIERANNLDATYPIELNSVKQQLEHKASQTQADGIQTQVNNLVLGAVGDGNNAEVVQARGSFAVLNDRLVDHETTVNQSDLFLNGLPAFELTAEYGTIDGTGIVSTTITTKSNIMTRKIMRTEFDTLKIIANVGYQVNYCFYDGNTFISRATWSSGTSQQTFNLTNTYDVVIIAAKYLAGEVVPSAEMLTNAFTASITKAIAFKTLSELSNEVNGIEYLGRIKSCEFDGKIIHFSFDDIYASLNQLITSPPVSIYNVAFFNDLKTLHETYGAVFTLNCFNTQTTVPTYDISNLPSTWQAEFQAAKGWMKFAYHGENEVSNYNSTVGIEASYAKFVAAIYNLTGDYDCIDPVTRLGFYGGSLANIGLIKDDGANKGITGLLSADDARLSYYLTQDQEDMLAKNGKYFDAANQMYFVRSMPRVDSNTDTQIIDMITSNLKYGKYAEIFVHESSWLASAGYKTRFQKIMTWANANGYINAYLSDIFNV